MFAFMTRLRAKPGCRDALIELNRTMQDQTAGEAGVPVYVFHTVEDDPDEFIYYDLYETQAAYDAHCASAAFQAMLGQLGELADILEMKKLVPFGPIKSEALSGPTAG
ncbi:MAG: antibiotic biosynthesis monooxygenase [Pseudomonadota bacterium]